MVFDPDGRIRSASQDAAAFFGFLPGQDLTDMGLEPLWEKIETRMSALQAEKFREEQIFLVGQIKAGQRPIATVCLVYADEPREQPDATSDAPFGNAYLPVVANFRKSDPTMLSVIYLDVLDKAKVDADGVVRCRLSRPRSRALKP
jgi:hypothetical protein